MNFIKNKILYTYDENNIAVPLYTIDDEMFLTADKIEGLFSINDLKKAVRARLSKRVVKVYKLNSDETINSDISEYVSSLSLNFKYQQGITRTGNISLMNYNNEFSLSPVKNTLWKNTKLRIDVGIVHKGNTFWKRCGIFVCGTFSIDEKTKQISFPLYDKFAMLDGTASGKVDSELQVPNGTPIRKAVQLCLGDDKGNGQAYDDKPIIFPSKYESYTTPYQITKTPETSIGDLILELADIVSCDASYNDVGNLVFEEGSDTTFYAYKPTLWFLEADDILEHPTQEVDFSKVINRVVVVGSIENGYQHKATLENTNLQSQNNIYMTDINPLYIEDTNLISDKTCMDRAKYEMKKQGILTKNIKIKTTFIPHLLPNTMIVYNNERHIISSIDMDLSDNQCVMSISMSNLKEVIFS